ncbi:hypothetical protein [Gordonia paraffinivorans]|uniref:hypothetical protein n=1 Tax=Gordonia paraffinivorans TaxID=175628 RepID=UPI001446AAD0|nr:hypothetical protein [Gordonia paraffinivorans]
MSISAAHAQSMARDVLRTVGIDVASTTAVVLTDGDVTGPHPEGYLVNPGQIEYAAEQFTLATGLSVDGDALTDALPWKEA